MSWLHVSQPESNALVSQLAREVGEGHSLLASLSRLSAMGRKAENDDVLFWDRHTKDVFVVHLTWQSGASTDPQYPWVSAPEGSEFEFINSLGLKD